AHDVGAYVVFINVDLDAVVDHRKHHDAGKRGVAARIGVEWRDAHQPVHAVLAFEPAIGVVALDRHGRRLDAGALAFGLLEPFDLVAVLLGPAHIHAHQHASPVLALGAASAGMDLEIAVVGVALAHPALAARLVAPEIGVFRLFVQLGKAALRGLDVKDASSAASATA